MTQQTVIIIIAEIILYSAIFWSGAAFGCWRERRWWRGEMVERGHARFHFYDGKWYWNENLPKPNDPSAHRVGKMIAEKQEAEIKRAMAGGAGGRTG